MNILPEMDISLVEAILGPFEKIKDETTQGSRTAIKGVCQAGGQKGLATVGGTTAATVCSKTAPFRVEFISDGIEIMATTTTIADLGSKGIKLKYWQNAC